MLVTYSSSEEDDTDKSTPAAKRRRLLDAQNKSSTRVSNHLPPLPADFHDLYATSVRSSTSDDPSLHGGRRRTTPHVPGNWPSHVYLEWFPRPMEVKILNAVLEAVQASLSTGRDTKLELHSLITSGLGAALPLHISLSASLSLTSDSKDVFLEKLSTALRNVHGLRDFEVRLTKLLWAPNHDRTRWFLVAGIEKPAKDELNLLLSCCNHICQQSKLPTLYNFSGETDGPEPKGAAAAPLRQGNADATGPSQHDYSDMFHFSLGWSLEEPTKKTLDLGGAQASITEELKNIRVQFDSVKVKIGNTIASVPLGRLLNERSVLI